MLLQSSSLCWVFARQAGVAQVHAYAAGFAALVATRQLTCSSWNLAFEPEAAFCRRSVSDKFYRFMTLTHKRCKRKNLVGV